MQLNRMLATLTLVAGLAAVSATDAHAKGIPFIFNTGEDSFESGPLPAPFDQDPELAGAKAGYVCDIMGVMWAYFKISNCRAGAIRGNDFFTGDELTAAVKAKYPGPTIGFWNKWGFWLLLVLIVGGVAAVYLLGRGSSNDDDEAEPRPATNDAG